MPTINVDDAMDRWRYRCPHGHTSWEPTNNHFWCQACSRAEKHHDDIDPSFDTLVDQRSGEELHRSEVEIWTDAGSYDEVGRRV